VIYLSAADPVYSFLRVLAARVLLRIDNGKLTMGDGWAAVSPLYTAI
jgi:hypothetical protein